MATPNHQLPKLRTPPQMVCVLRLRTVQDLLVGLIRHLVIARHLVPQGRVRLLAAPLQVPDSPPLLTTLRDLAQSDRLDRGPLVRVGLLAWVPGPGTRRHQPDPARDERSRQPCGSD